MDDQLRAKFWNLYTETFHDLYRYCARRATMKPVIAFIMKSLYENALDEIKHGQEIILVDLYKWAYEFFAVQSQPKMAGGQVKRIHDFRDVYDIKTEAGSRAVRREQILENFYNHLEFKEREVLWLTYFEELLPPDRAYVMGMGEEENMKFFYESLKKAKTVVSMATSDQKGFGRIAAYFGGVASLLRKAKQHEQLDPDQEIYTSLRDMFMEQFGRTSQPSQPQPQPAAAAASSATGAPPPMRDPFADVPTVTGIKPVTATKAAEPAYDDESDEWEDESEFAAGLWKRVQGVLVVVMVIAAGSFAYFKFFSLDARVDRFINDSRVVFSSEFKPEDKVWFTEDVLLYLSKSRDFNELNVQRKDSMVQVNYSLKDKSIESFFLYPQEQKFDYKFKWQPKSYVRLTAV